MRLIDAVTDFIKTGSWADDPALMGQAQQFKQEQLGPTSFRGSNAAWASRVRNGTEHLDGNLPPRNLSHIGQGTTQYRRPPPKPYVNGATDLQQRSFAQSTARFQGQPRTPGIWGQLRAPFAGERVVDYMGTRQQQPFDYRQRDAARNARIAEMRGVQPPQAAARPAVPPAPAAPPKPAGPAVQRTHDLMDPAQHQRRIQQYQNLQTAEANKNKLAPVQESQQDYNRRMATANREKIQGPAATVEATRAADAASAQRAHAIAMAAKRREQDAFMASLPGGRGTAKRAFDLNAFGERLFLRRALRDYLSH